MEMLKCSLLMCQGLQRSKDELLQEKTASSYASKMKRSHHQFAIQEQIVHNHKSVFSFRLNCSRNYDQSDKKKRSFAQNQSRNMRLLQGIKCCTSVQRLPFKPIQETGTIQSSRRYFASPQQYRPIQSLMLVPKNLQRCPQIMYRNQMQQFNKPCIRFTRNDKVDMNPINVLNEKNLTETSYSSISSLQKLTKNKENQSNSHGSSKVFQAVQYQYQNIEQKLQLRNSSFEQRSNQKQSAQIVYPSFDKLQNIQHRRFFENANTIKSIFTSNQLKDRSLFNSFIDCNKNMEILQDQQISLELIDHLNARKMNKFSQNKRKTAYFGCVQDSNGMQKIFFNDYKEVEEDSIDENQRIQGNKKKKVKFQTQVNLLQIKLQTGNKPQIKKPIFHQQENNQKAIYQPSLHNIIQSTQIEHKISIQNSIKQMPLINHEVVQDNGGKFKYVNTIKSIGGQSSISQNSYIDIKFMQNLNSRKAVVKLV